MNQRYWLENYYDCVRWLEFGSYVNNLNNQHMNHNLIAFYMISFY